MYKYIVHRKLEVRTNIELQIFSRL